MRDIFISFLLLLVVVTAHAQSANDGPRVAQACTRNPTALTASGAAITPTSIAISIENHGMPRDCLTSRIQIRRNGSPLGEVSADGLSFFDRDLSPNTLYTYTVYFGGNVIAILPVKTLAASPITYMDTFEQDAANAPGIVPPGWSPVKPMSMYVSDTRARAGKKSFYINFSRSMWANDENGRHSTVSQSPASQAVHAVMGQDIWVGFSVYLDQWDADDPSNGELFAQWHGAAGSVSGLGPGGCSSPPVAIYTHGDELEVATNYSNSGDTNNIHTHYLYTEALTAKNVGRWVDWVMKINFDFTRGTVDVWRNGVHVVSYVGPDIYHCAGENAVGPYFNWGVYKWDWGNKKSRVKTRSAYFDEYRQGNAMATCRDVKPTGSRACAP